MTTKIGGKILSIFVFIVLGLVIFDGTGFSISRFYDWNDLSFFRGGPLDSFLIIFIAFMFAFFTMLSLAKSIFRDNKISVNEKHPIKEFFSTIPSMFVVFFVCFIFLFYFGPQKAYDSEFNMNILMFSSLISFIYLIIFSIFKNKEISAGKKHPIKEFFSTIPSMFVVFFVCFPFLTRITISPFDNFYIFNLTVLVSSILLSIIAGITFKIIGNKLKSLEISRVEINNGFSMAE